MSEYKEYPWAANRSKLERAISEVRGDNPNTGEVGTQTITEEAVKAVYIRLAGLVVEDKPESVESEEVVEKPRRGRRATS